MKEFRANCGMGSPTYLKNGACRGPLRSSAKTVGGLDEQGRRISSCQSHHGWGAGHLDHRYRLFRHSLSQRTAGGRVDDARRGTTAAVGVARHACAAVFTERSGAGTAGVADAWIQRDGSAEQRGQAGSIRADRQGWPRVRGAARFRTCSATGAASAAVVPRAATAAARAGRHAAASTKRSQRGRADGDRG